MAARRYELTDTQWDRIKDLIPRAKTSRPPKDDRMMLNAMLWLARSGAAWADIPARFGSHQTVYSRFCKWRDDGTLLRIFQELNADADYENLCIDSTSIKAHPQSAGAKRGAVNSENNQFIGVSHGGKTTKIHAVVDALGNPVHFLLTGGNIFDASVAVDLLSEVNISESNILGDKAYGTKSIRTYITEQRASYTIPPKSNVIEPWFCDFHTYKERHLIECFFNKLKVFRRVATRFDKLAVSFLAFVHLASIWILLK
ncbi:MAG: IS5 family transposase [Oscillospiraceae bacterium]